MRAVLLDACSATLLELGALTAPREQPSWQVLHMRARVSQQACQAASQLQQVVLRELPPSMLEINSQARGYAAEYALRVYSCVAWVADVQLVWHGAQP